MYSWKKRLMKIHYHLEKVSIVTQISKIFLIPIINIKKSCGKILATIMTYICKETKETNKLYD